MIRLVLQNILLFLLPTLLYVIYIMIRRTGDKSNTVTRALETAPLPLLSTLGFIVMIAVLAYFGTQSDGGKPGQKYYPPEVVNGKIKPGRFE